MLKKYSAWWTHVLLYFTVHVIIVNGFIEIVEEQQCHDRKIRLTCRELDAHIAVLEAWYTSIGDYHRSSNASSIQEDLRLENDTELDRNYVYASPMHNGVYELINSTSTENITEFYSVDINYTNDSFSINETVDQLMELLNVSDMCSVFTYSRRYTTWESRKRQWIPNIKGSSINLIEPLRNRCSGAVHCSFILKKTLPPALDWLPGVIYIKYSCSHEIVEEQQCYDSEIRLTCRELDSHIAVLEAWYTSMEDYSRALNVSGVPENFTLKTENDSELDRVYVYSSPNHNGVYQLTNSSVLENVTDYNSNVNTSYFNDTKYLTDSFINETVDMTVEFINGSEMCNLLSYTRSYASWHDGGKRQRPFARNTSINLRAPLSYRCTGVNHCNFLLEEDYPPALHWPPGVVSIKYACFDDSLTVHYCNREVRVAEFGPDSEGYIRTPGYPHFYVGDECRWRLKANVEQRIRVSLLDVSLRSIGPFEEQCTDSVSVVDSNGDSLLFTCEQVYLPLRLMSTTNTVEVIVEAKSQGAFPKRGVLLHYKSLGCVTLPAPSDGYLVYRNEDFAHYMCNVNFVFANTRQRALMLWCFNDNTWNGTIPSCIEETTKKVVGNVSSTQSPDKDTKLPHNEANMIVDIVIPSLLIAALFIGNAFIVIIIYKYRKRKNEDLDDEFNTIPLSVNGGMHSAGNAV